MIPPEEKNLQSAEGEFKDNVQGRHRTGLVWRILFQFSTVVGIIALVTLLLTIINQSSGIVVYEAKVNPVLAIDSAGLRRDGFNDIHREIRGEWTAG